MQLNPCALLKEKRNAINRRLLLSDGTENGEPEACNSPLRVYSYDLFDLIVRFALVF